MRTTGDMSLLEKMSLWSKSSGYDRPELDKSDLFSGVKDEDESAEHSELSTYSKAIVSSTAYEWLINSLSREALFHWGEGQPKIMIDAIRQPILKRLSKGVMSRRKAPDTYTVTFRLPWYPLQLRIEEEKRTGWPSPNRPISQLVVMASSSADQVQAITVKQYFHQTWACGGTRILHVVQKVSDGVLENVMRGNEYLQLYAGLGSMNCLGFGYDGYFQPYHEHTVIRAFQLRAPEARLGREWERVLIALDRLTHSPWNKGSSLEVELHRCLGGRPVRRDHGDFDLCSIFDNETGFGKRDCLLNGQRA